MRKIWIAALVALATSGCAVGNRYSYSAVPEIGAQGTRTLVVAVQDSRSYVLSKNKTPDFVGLQRGGFGNPFDVRTESGRPLADEFSSAISQALERKGFKPSTATLAPGASGPQWPEIAAKAGAERIVLVTIREWKSDTMQNVTLHFDLSLQVLDAGGAELASNRLTGEEELGGSFFDPPSHARSAVPIAYQKKLASLFAPDKIVQSLR